MNHPLIAYFSRADENYFSGALRTVEVGNTEIAAKLLCQQVNGDLFKIEPMRRGARISSTTPS